MSLDIAIDFDGTCVTHDYPQVGRQIGAVPVLKELTEASHRLILFTMRSGDQLVEAVNWFAENEIELYGVQWHPEQRRWTDSNKCFANIYIDDAALGIPLRHGHHKRPYVDWDKVRELLIEQNILK